MFVAILLYWSEFNHIMTIYEVSAKPQSISQWCHMFFLYFQILDNFLLRRRTLQFFVNRKTCLICCGREDLSYLSWTGRTVQTGELLCGVFVVDLYLTSKHQISDGKQFRYNVTPKHWFLWWMATDGTILIKIINFLPHQR